VLNVLKMRLAQIVDSVRADGWSSLLREAVFLRRTAIRFYHMIMFITGM